MAQEPEGPEGPEEIEEGSEHEHADIGSGIRGRITGVTRVGPKALMLGGLVAGGLVFAITFGHSKPQTSTATPQSPPTIAAAPHTESGEQGGNAHFGEDVPIVATPEPTDTPIILPDAGQAQGGRPILLPPVASTTMPTPAPTVDPAVLAEQQKRLALLDQAVHSSIINTSNAPATPNPLGNGNGNGQASGSNGFLNGPFGQNKEDYLQSRRVDAPSQYLITASSVIPAETITGIDTEAPGMISAQVREDVYDSKTGRYLLIPRGSRLVGVYKNNVSFGQGRVLIAWTRLIFPDTSSIDLENMSGADTEGYAGFGGKVDNHNGMLFEAALLTSLLNVGATITQPQGSGNGFQNTGQSISSAIGQTVAQVGGQVMGRALNITPTIHIPKGYPFLVVVDRDIILPGPYEGS